MDKAIRMLFSNHHYDAYNSFLSKGYMMSANDKHALIRIQFLEPTIPKFEDVELASKKLRIVIEYESIYNQTQMYDSDNYRILN